MKRFYTSRRSRANIIKCLIILVIICIFIYALFPSSETVIIIRQSELYDFEIVRCKEQLRIPSTEIYSDIVEIPTEGKKKKDNIECYHIKSNSLSDISEINPRPGKSIFFHETSCNSYHKGKVTINSRQACAVESAARLNPNMDVYLLYSSPGVFEFECEESDLFLQALLSYNNVFIMHVDYEKYTKGTPIEKIYNSGILDKSRHGVEHASDINRYLTLWKYGGIYLDLDVLVIKSLEDLKPNFAGTQNEEEPGAGVLSFDAYGDGHLWAEMCLNDLNKRFTGKSWSDSSVGVLTRLLTSLCGVKTIDEMQKKDCNGYKLYPQDVFYAIPYETWTYYFRESKLDYVLNKTENSYVIHMWNNLSQNSKINVNASKVPYLYFAEKYCPKVVNATINLF